MKVGILGAGQLSQMLALAAPPRGLDVHVLGHQPQEPALQVTAQAQTLGVWEASAIANWAAKLDFVTFESEFIKADFLQTALSGSKAKIFPNLNALGILQNRLTQKAFYLQHKLPSAPFLDVRSLSDLDRAFQFFKGHFVLKLKTDGYDGKGTFHCDSAAELAQLKNSFGKFPQGFIAESKVKFKRELSAMCFRSRAGDFKAYPLVESRQVENRCDLVLGPVSHPAWPKMLKQMNKALAAIDYVGAIGVELFDLGTKLWINEVAPRVHNSGHYSQNAMNFDQFTLHWLCALQDQLPELQMNSKAFGMANLIGAGRTQSSWEALGNCHLHWYNKTENRAGRKMGHLNATGKNKKEVEKNLISERKKFSI